MRPIIVLAAAALAACGAPAYDPPASYASVSQADQNLCAMQAVAQSSSASGGPLYQTVLEAQLRNACIQAKAAH